MQRVSDWYGRLLTGLALAGGARLLLMMLMICADVLLRNVRILPGVHGVAWSNEASEYALYLITLLTAPWLLRQGQHIRVDIVLRALPRRLGWYCEWLVDALALACCLQVAYSGWLAAAASSAIGSMVVKVLAIPEWWLLAPLPLAFLLLAIETVFRMRRLYLGARAPRDDAVTAS